MSPTLQPKVRRARIDWHPSAPGRTGVLAWLLHPPVLAALIILGWVAMPLAVNTAQYGDHFEQFDWAQSLEWGYHKHPPLPTWMLAAAIQLGGMQAWWPSVLAGTCIALNLLLTWRIACRLIGADRAGLAVLFAGLQQGFAGKAQLFNHNSVMVLCVSVVVLLALRASQLDGRTSLVRQTWRWALIGLVSGLALLTKYQAALPLLGVLYALWRSGTLQSSRNRGGLLLALALGVLVVLPHLSWVALHGWSTLAYATQAGVELTVLNRLASLASFTAIQVRIMAPALLMLLVMGIWQRRDGRQAQSSASDDAGAVMAGMPDEGARDRQIWLTALIGVPVAGMVLAALLGGLRLQDHWGIQTFQYLGLLVAARWRGPVTTQWLRWVCVALVLHTAWALSYSAPRWSDHAQSSRKRLDQFFPARQVADAVTRVWQDNSPAGCALRFVRGPGFEAGLIHIYAASQPAQVAENLEHTPWLQPSQLAGSGYIHVSLNEPPQQDEWSAGYVLRGQIGFDVPAQSRHPHQTLHWMIVPAAACLDTP